MEFQEKLKKLRSDAHMTQQQLADAVFVSRTLVTKWESGARFPSAESVKMLCTLFSVSEAELLCITELREDSASVEQPVAAVETSPLQGSGRPKRRADRLSRFYAAVCKVLTASLLLLLAAHFIRGYVRGIRSGIGALALCSAYALPITVMSVWELFNLRRTEGSRIRELYALLQLILCWIGCMALYAFTL